MRLPRQLLINEDIWTVKLVRKLEHPEYKNVELLGLCDPADFTLSVKAGLSKRERLETFVHEVLHAIENSYDLKIPHRLIYKLEKPIVDFLIENFIGPP